MMVKHPISGLEIPGRKLKSGETIQNGDMYDSSSGKWEPLQSSNGAKVPGGSHVTWVRPN